MNWKTHAFALFVAVCLLGSLVGCSSHPVAANPSTVDWSACRPVGKLATGAGAGKKTFNYVCRDHVVALVITRVK